VTLVNLGDIHRKRGDSPQAILLFEKAIPLYRGLKNTRAANLLEQELSRLRAEEPAPPGR